MRKMPPFPMAGPPMGPPPMSPPPFPPKGKKKSPKALLPPKRKKKAKAKTLGGY